MYKKAADGITIAIKANGVLCMYEDIKDVPEENRPLIERMILKGVLNKNIKEEKLTDDMIKMFIILDRLDLL